MKIGIVGFGHVGNSIYALFPDAVIFDTDKNIGKKEDINNCDIAYICVPTPTNKDGCDTSIVENVISWCEAKLLVIRSTVKVGFTDEMREKYKKRIVFQPEYFGETKNHPFKNEKMIPWVTLGGEEKDLKILKDLYEKMGFKVNLCLSKEAEFAKYLCNTFLAMKVTFANEMYEIAEKLGVNYDVSKSLMLEDPRIGKTHLDVYKDNRGFSGSCFPKDTKALLIQSKKVHAENDLLKATIKVNKKMRKLNK